MTKNLFIKTYGCQMNVYDSQRMADALAPQGYRLVEQPDEADLVVLNTCHIREKASEKVFSELGRLNRIKMNREAEGGTLVIGVGGCVAQAEGAELIRRAPYVDMVFGPQTTHRLPEMVSRATRGTEKNGIIDTDFAAAEKFDELPAPTGTNRSSAFLSIQEGCDKFCTFCVVPYTRGAEFSRPQNDIILEAQTLVDQGVREITLLGQNVNAYRNNGIGLADLLENMSQIDDLKRIRYTTSHPRDMDDALVAAHGTNEKLMPFLHLPVQSGSDTILRAMNRGHGVDRFFDIIDRLRAARPDIAFSSDFIVGFPGETDADFEATLDLIGRIEFAQAYSFKYSPRPGTPAADMNDQVPEPIKNERLAALQDLITQQQKIYNASHIGSHTSILFESAGRNENQYIGRTPYNQSVHVTGDATLLGTVRQVELTISKSHSLEGRLIESAGATI